VQIQHHPVVLHDHHLIIGEDHRQKVIVGLVSGMTGPFLAAFGLDVGRRRAAVVPISHVQVRHLLRKQPGQAVHLAGLGDDPQRVPYPVLGHEVHLGGAPGELLDGGVDLGSSPVGQKHRPGIGADDIHVTGPFLLLVRPGVLVLFDQVPLVLLHRGAGHQAHLEVIAHALLVQVVAGVLVADHQPLVHEALQVLGAVFEDLDVVGIQSAVQLGELPVVTTPRPGGLLCPRFVRFVA
jgi:hypothetical protein